MRIECTWSGEKSRTWSAVVATWTATWPAGASTSPPRGQQSMWRHHDHWPGMMLRPLSVAATPPPIGTDLVPCAGVAVGSRTDVATTTQGLVGARRRPCASTTQATAPTDRRPPMLQVAAAPWLARPTSTARSVRRLRALGVSAESDRSRRSDRRVRRAPPRAVRRSSHRPWTAEAEAEAHHLSGLQDPERNPVAWVTRVGGDPGSWRRALCAACECSTRLSGREIAGDHSYG